MPRTRLTAKTPPGSYPALPLGSAAGTLTMAGADVANGNDCLYSGNALVIVHNTNASPQTITFTSSADPTTKRTGDITDHPLAADAYEVFGPFTGPGWRQPGGLLFIDASHAEVLIEVVNLPG